MNKYPFIKIVLPLVFYVLLSSFGLFKIKLSKNILDFNFIIGFFAYSLGFVIWLIILKLNPLSVAFPVAASSLIVATQVISIVFLKEPFSTSKFLGVVLIVLGIYFISSEVRSN